MRMPDIKGLIRRRILVNYRVDPSVIQRQLPGSFHPKLQRGYAVAGICLIRLEDIRPKLMPPPLGINSENAAHRIAVTWEDGAGVHEGVYIPRRDTSSWINRVAGGRIFPGEHNPATFDVRERGDHIHFRMESRDRLIKVELSASVSSDIPSDSCFHSMEEASSFFEGGSIGYSVTADKRRLDGIRLRTEDWKVQPLAVEKVYSSYFADASLFPEGSTSFDCALIMRSLRHQWVAENDLYIEPAESAT